MTRLFDPEKHCGARARQRGNEPCVRYRAVGARRCKIHGGVTDRRPARPNQKSGLYGRKLVGAEERELYGQVLDAIRADVPGLVAEQLALEVTTQALAIQRNGLPVDEAGQDALARKSAVIAKLVTAAATARAQEPKAETPISITIGGGDSRVMVRTPDGPAVALRAPDGRLLLPAPSGEYRPAVKHVVDGAEIFSLPLEADPATGDE